MCVLSMCVNIFVLCSTWDGMLNNHFYDTSTHGRKVMEYSTNQCENKIICLQ